MVVSAQVGEVPMVCRLQSLLCVDMKTPRTHPEKSPRTPHQEAQPQPEPIAWRKAVPPRIGGQEAVSGVAEWRPGEPARRGYEKAVEDWWWL